MPRSAEKPEGAEPPASKEAARRKIIRNSYWSLPFMIWVSLSQDSIHKIADHWDDPARASMPPVFGWLCNELPYDQPPELNCDARAQ
ncbi:MAG: hypothetical protein JWQ56_1574 [Pseudarthrobacter sp.]|nr:hypothetical protein [Pseudarthrobacter sp.]